MTDDLERGRSPVAEKLLALFADDIEAAGGALAHGTGTYGLVGDPEWHDLADTYLRACEFLGRPPKIRPSCEADAGDEDDEEDDEDEHLVECLVCNEHVPYADSESTYCGSIHPDCAPEHAKECEVCRKDFIERGLVRP